MKTLIITILLIFSMQTFAQKKLVPATKSDITGISLPEGSQKDMRMIVVGAAKIILETESKKNNAVIKSPEVLYIPAVNAQTFTKAFLENELKKQGWQLTAADDQDYFWLEKNGKFVVAYFAADKKEINVYFSESDKGKSSNSQTNTINTNNTTNNETQQNTNTETTTNTNSNTNQPQYTNNNTVVPEQPVSTDGFKFNTTNFDDGWTSTVQEDWVEVTKGTIKVLLHFPKEGTIFPADPAPLTNAAWNILVAPRYSNLTNYKTAYISTYNRPYLGMGYAKENSSGAQKFVVLFRQGETGWIEFICPDKNSFIQEFKLDPETVQWDTDSDLMNPLSRMKTYNRFAIAASDFKGKWTSDFTGIQQLYYVYTGNYAGMNIHQSNEEFMFSGNTYKWKLLAINGMVGNTRYDHAESSGTFTVPNNWQLQCSKIEKGPKTYNAFWSCIKGARVLNLIDAQYPGSGLYTQYGLAK